MTTRYFKATFADGTVKIRSTTTRDYAAAWRFAYVSRHYPDAADGGASGGKRIERFGFSASAGQAATNLSGEQRAWGGFDGEVAACVPCTKQGAIIPEGFEPA